MNEGGDAMICGLTAFCYKIWKAGDKLTLSTQSLIITLPKKGNSRLCQTSCTALSDRSPEQGNAKILFS